MSATLGTTFGRALRRAALPLGCYYAVTLAMPFANGAASAGRGFGSHALAVLILPPVLIALACIIHVAVLRIVGRTGRQAAPGRSSRPLRSARPS